MSETTDAEGTWPSTCEECGTELQTVQVQFTEAEFSEGKTGTPVNRDVCPNPDCPRHDAELAGLTSPPPVTGERTPEDPENDELRNRPGSLGGDHGGG